MTDISKMQESTEAFALMVAQYYDGLKRSGMPADLVATLTEQFQSALVQQAFKQQASSAIAQWIAAQKKQ